MTLDEPYNAEKLQTILIAAESKLWLSYPDHYPDTHNKLHIAGVTLEGLDDYERFVIVEMLDILQARDKRLLERVLNRLEKHAKAYRTHDMLPPYLLAVPLEVIQQVGKEIAG